MHRETSYKNSIRQFLLEVVSFSTARARVFNLTSILLILAIVPTEKLSYSPVKCIFKHFLLPLVFGGDCPTVGLFADCNCPACGMTRAMSRLLHGDLGEAMGFNRGVILVLLVMVVLVGLDICSIIKTREGT